MDFPYVTTFMASEMAKVKKRGIPIIILPINRHSFKNVQEVYYELQKDVHYTSFFGFSNLMAAMYFILKSPVKLLSVLWDVISSVRRPLKYIIQTWAVLPMAIYYAWYIQRLGINHVHANWAHYPATIAYIINKLTGVPFSFSSHAGADIYRNVDMLDKKIKSSMFSFTCVQANKIFMENLLKVNLDEKVHVVYHGVNLEKFQMKPRGSILAIDKPYILMSVGNLHEAKGFHYMLDACKHLKNNQIEYKYYIVGKGYFRKRLSRIIRQLGLQDNVLLTGQVLHKDLVEIFQKAHVFIMPSIILPNGGRDGIPNVVIEAMAMGVPVVGSSTAGIPEAVAHEQTGILVPPSDPEALASGVMKVLEDTELRKRLVRNARLFVEEHFDREKNFEKIFEVLKNRVLL